MCISEKIEKLLSERGTTQAWVVTQMNNINPSIKMDAAKFSAIVKKKRKISGDELLAFCMALAISPDVFLKSKTD